MNLVGRTLGPYTLEAPLGKGGMAMVYRAYQASVKRYVAIKVMAPAIANEPGFVERFEREAEVVAALEHPHILPIIDYGQAEGLHYIVMRFMDGGSLDDKMRQGALALSKVARYLAQIASALDYAHSRGVIHRDLKPNNVLLDKTDNCYLTDFGIARLADSERKLTQTGSVMGTPAYMSPEQAMGRPVDARSDLYTLGVMLYEMILGQLPFSGDTPAALIFQHVYEPPRSPKQIKPDLPDAVVEVLDRALAKNPDARYQSANDLAETFAEAISSRAPTRPVSAPPVDTERTYVGGPATPMAADRTVTPPTAPAHPTRGASSTAAGAAPTAFTPTPLGAAPVAEQPVAAARRGLPIGLIVLALVALLAIGGGAALVISNTNNANATATAQQIALLALSFTPTATATPPATDTPTLTPTSTPTPTDSPTPTPNATQTFIALRLETANAMEAGLTATAQTQAAASLTAAAEATSAAIAAQIATVNAFNTLQAEATQAALAATLTATAATATPTFDAVGTARANETRTAATAAARTATAVAVNPTPANAISELVLNDPQALIRRLRAERMIPPQAKVARALNSREQIDITGKVTAENVFYLEPFSRAQFYDFVLSFDLTLFSAEDGEDKTGCGFFINGTNENYDGTSLLDADMLPFYFYRSQRFRFDRREDGEWASAPIISGRSNLIQAANEVSSRVSAVVVGGRVTVFLNGLELFERQVDGLEGGIIGFYFVRGIPGETERCEITNVLVLRLS